MFRRREIEERLHARENLLLIHLLQNKKKTPKTKIPDPCTAPKTHTHTHTQTDQTTKATMPKKPPKKKNREHPTTKMRSSSTNKHPQHKFTTKTKRNKSTTRILLVPLSFSFPV
jgi:hypothetical protein